MLRSGYHDTLSVGEYYNSDYITLMAEPGHSPRLGFIQLRSASKWKLHGLVVSPEFLPVYGKRILIHFESHNHSGASFDCVADSCTGYSRLDATGWSKEDWNNFSCHAIMLSGHRMIARRNHFKNVNNLEVSRYQDYFLDYAAMDLRLKTGSPAIDAGVAASAPGEDRNGLARLQGAAVDVGAYEFNGNPGSLRGDAAASLPIWSLQPGTRIFDLQGRRWEEPGSPFPVGSASRRKAIAYRFLHAYPAA